GPAADGADFVNGFFPNGSIIFPIDVTGALLTVFVQGDSIVEPDENFVVTISNPNPAATITQATAIGIIRDDERAPVITPRFDPWTVAVNHSLPASSLFTAADANGHAVTQYEFQDVGAGATSGHFTLNGVAQPQGDATFAVTAAQFLQLEYTGGSVAGSEAVWVRGSDPFGTFGDWKRFVMTTEPNHGPVVTPTAGTQTVVVSH